LAAVTSPLLEIVRVRIDVAGVPAVDGLSAATTGDRVLVLGGAGALFEGASGVRTPSHGELRLRGETARTAVRAGTAAGAPLEPPLPPKWTAREYVTWSARICGYARKDAGSLAAQAMERMQMNALADEPLAKASTQTRRATSIAAALATGARTLILEDPTRGLPDDVARHFARVLIRALEGCGWAVFASRVSLASPLAMDADEAIVVAGDRVVGQGAPAELAARERAYAVRVLGPAEDFSRIASERGAIVSGHGAQLTIDLGESLAVSDLLRAALEARATILELRPLAHAFA
jgi:ABC-type multidrug transport system ATPase subunit